MPTVVYKKYTVTEIHVWNTRGVKRISGPIYEETRSILKSFLAKVIGDALECICGRRRTITAVDVVEALKRQFGITLYGVNGFGWAHA